MFPVTTTVLNMALHCQGCIDKIKKLVKKTEGFKDILIDKSKSLVTVKRGMDMKLLTAAFEGIFKTKVEVVQAKYINEKKGKCSGGDDKEGKESRGIGKESRRLRLTISLVKINPPIHIV